MGVFRFEITRGVYFRSPKPIFAGFTVQIDPACAYRLTLTTGPTKFVDSVAFVRLQAVVFLLACLLSQHKSEARIITRLHKEALEFAKIKIR